MSIDAQEELQICFDLFQTLLHIDKEAGLATEVLWSMFCYLRLDFEDLANALEYGRSEWDI